MESRLAELFSLIENSLDSNTYSFSDTDYLVKKHLTKYIIDNNSLTASARQIESPEEAVETILSNTISELAGKLGDPAEWYRAATSRVVEFVEFANTNEGDADVLRYASLLPVGHPRADRVVSLTASAHRNALAEWMSADPRLSEEASHAIYKMYSRSEFDNLEVDFENMKLEAMVASGSMPKDLLPVVAAFKMSRAARSMMSKLLARLRRRDRKGQFANEFGRLSGIFSGDDGQLFSEAGDIVGPGSKPNHFEVQFDGTGKVPAGIYEMDAAKSKNVRGYLPKEAVKGLEAKETITPEDAKFAVPLSELMKTRREVPKGWKKENMPDGGVKYTTTDGKYSAIAKNRSDMKQIMSKLKGYDYIESGSAAGKKYNDKEDGFVVTRDSKGRFKLPDGKDDNRFPWINPATGEIFDPSDVDLNQDTRPNLIRGVANDWSGIAEVTSNARAVDDEGGSPDLSPDLDTFNPDAVVSQLGEITDSDGKSFVDLDNKKVTLPDGTKIAGRIDDDGNNFVQLLDDDDSVLQEMEVAGRPDFAEVEGIVNEFIGGKFQQEQDDLDDDVDLDQGPLSRSENYDEMDSDLQKEIDDAIDRAAKGFDKRRRINDERLENGEIDEGEHDEAAQLIDGDQADFEEMAKTDDSQGNLDYFKNSAGDESDVAEATEDVMEAWVAQNNRNKDASRAEDDDVDLDQDASSSVDDYIEENFLNDNYKNWMNISRQENPVSPSADQDVIDDGVYTSPDGRIKVDIQTDADMDGDQLKGERVAVVEFDGEDITDGGISLGGDPDADSAIDRIQAAVGEYLDDNGDINLNQETAPGRLRQTSTNTDLTLPDNLTPEQRDRYQPFFDRMENAIREGDMNAYDIARGEMLANDDREGVEIPGDVFNRAINGENLFYRRKLEVDNALYNGDEAALERLLADDKYQQHHDRIEDMLEYLSDDDVDLDQEVKALSAAQLEPASPKQYALLDEILQERELDETTAQAISDALSEKNLNKAQAGALINATRAAEFKPDVDGTKPSDRMLNSLQDYLATKDLSPGEVKETLDSLEADGSRDNVERLLNKLRRKKDRPVDLNQEGFNTERFDNAGEFGYEWSNGDSYVDVVPNDRGGFDVFYEVDDINDRGGKLQKERSFSSEGDALQFGNDLIDEYEKDGGSDLSNEEAMMDPGDVDLDQDVRGTLEDPATDKQYDFLNSLLANKEGIDPETAAGVRSALENRNLTKGQAGAFIGGMRGLADKPNTKPTPKQEASIKRAVLERGLSDSEADDIMRRLDEGVTFDEASEILNDLKSRDITEDGVDKLVNQLQADGDEDTLRYILDKPEYAPFRDKIASALGDDDVDLNQEADAGLSRDIPDLDTLAENVDAEDRIAVDGQELKDYVTGFDETTDPSTKMEMVDGIRFVADSMKDPILRRQLNDLADEKEAEAIDEFGPAAMAPFMDLDNDADYLDYYDIESALENESDMFFETDVEDIKDKLDSDGSYGDDRAGAEGQIIENEDGTFTARLSRADGSGSEQTNFDDRDDAIDFLAGEISEANQEMRPDAYDNYSYGDGLVTKSRNIGKDDESQLEFAEELDRIALALSENRGNPNISRKISEMAENIRDAIQRRNERNERNAPDGDLTPESMDEASRDNESGDSYVERVFLDNDNYKNWMSTSRKDNPVSPSADRDVIDDGTYNSPDGRVEIDIQTDADFDGEEFRGERTAVIRVDGEEITNGGIDVNYDADTAIDRIQAEVAEYLDSKKA